jgi:hypothetical protein
MSDAPEVTPMVAPPAPYGNYMNPAFAGMKGDSTEDQVATFAANAAIGFGLVCSRTAAAALTVVAGGTIPIGVSLHDHTIASRGGYMQYDAVSILEKGKAWCQVADPVNVVDGAYVAFDATGKVQFTTGAGFTVLPKAVFRSAAIDVYDITYSTTTKVALVELNYGLAVG